MNEEWGAEDVYAGLTDLVIEPVRITYEKSIRELCISDCDTIF